MKRRPTPEQVSGQLAALEQLAGYRVGDPSADGMGKLKPGDVVLLAGHGQARYAVMDIAADGLVHLQSQQGTRLRAGWRALRWRSEVTA